MIESTSNPGNFYAAVSAFAGRVLWVEDTTHACHIQRREVADQFVDMLTRWGYPVAVTERHWSETRTPTTAGYPRNMR